MDSAQRQAESLQSQFPVYAFFTTPFHFGQWRRLAGPLSSRFIELPHLPFAEGDLERVQIFLELH